MEFFSYIQPLSAFIIAIVAGGSAFGFVINLLNRPIKADIKQLETGQTEMKKDIKQLEIGQTEMKKDIKQLEIGQTEMRENIKQIKQLLSRPVS